MDDDPRRASRWVDTTDTPAAPLVHSLSLRGVSRRSVTPNHLRSPVVASRPLVRIRKICLGLPEAYEEETWGAATFRVQKKIFALVANGSGTTTASMKAARGDQEAMLSQGDPFFYPPYVGSKGWIGIDLRSASLDWEEVAEVVQESYRLVAPKRLSARMT